MPALFGTTILTVTYTKATYEIACTGQAFGINEYSGISNIEVSKSGSGTWTSVSAITLWGDEAVSGTLATALGAGTYDVRVTSSDNEQDTYENAIKITAGNSVYLQNIEELTYNYGIM